MVGPSQGNTKGSKKAQVLMNRINSNSLLRRYTVQYMYIDNKSQYSSRGIHVLYMVYNILQYTDDV